MGFDQGRNRVEKLKGLFNRLSYLLLATALTAGCALSMGCTAESPLPTPTTEQSLPEVEEESMDQMILGVDGKSFTAVLEDNETARALVDRLPLSIPMVELNGNEKYYQFAEPLPANPQSVNRVEAGDIMLFQDDCLVIFYEGHSTSYPYTPIGKIGETEGLATALGTGNVTVELESTTSSEAVS